MCSLDDVFWQRRHFSYVVHAAVRQAIRCPVRPHVCGAFGFSKTDPAIERPLSSMAWGLGSAEWPSETIRDGVMLSGRFTSEETCVILLRACAELKYSDVPALADRDVGSAMKISHGSV